MKNNMMQCIVYEGVNKIALKKMPVPVISKEEVLIKVAYAGICGTDLNIYQGAHPRAAAPLVMGHELSGTVVGDDPQLKEGTRVTVRPLIFCGQCEPCRSGASHVCQSLKLYGIDTAGSFAGYIKVARDKVHVLPDFMDLKLAAFAEPLAVGVHAVSKSGVTGKSKVVVFGAGTIGLATAAALKLLKTENILIIETNPFRLKMAAKLGLTVVDGINDCIEEKIKAFTNGKGADCLFDCAGQASVAEQLAHLTRVQGTVVIVGAYKKPAALDLLAVMFKEINIIGVRVYEARDFDVAIDLLKQNFDFSKIITHIMQPEQAREAFDLLINGGEAVKIMFKF